jgi:hypothetical protein
MPDQKRPSGSTSSRGRLSRIRLFFGLAVALTALVGLVGLGTAPNASGTQLSESAGATVDSSTMSKLPTPAQLKSALLNADDVGLKESKSTDSGHDGSTASGCSEFAKILNEPSEAQEEQDAEFTGGDSGPFLGEQLMTEEPAKLASDYAQVSKALASCKSLSYKYTDGTLTFALSPIKFGGPGAVAVRMDGESNGVQVNGYLAVERLGDVALSYSFMQVGDGSSMLASTYYEQAVSKVRKELPDAVTDASSQS